MSNAVCRACRLSNTAYSVIQRTSAFLHATLDASWAGKISKRLWRSHWESLSYMREATLTHSGNSYGDRTPYWTCVSVKGRKRKHCKYSLYIGNLAWFKLRQSSIVFLQKFNVSMSLSHAWIHVFQPINLIYMVHGWHLFRTSATPVLA